MTVSWATRKHWERAWEWRDRHPTNRQRRAEQAGGTLHCTTPLHRFLITFTYAAETLKDRKITNSWVIRKPILTRQLHLHKHVEIWHKHEQPAPITATFLKVKLIIVTCCNCAAASRNIENVPLLFHFYFWGMVPPHLTTLQLKACRIGCMQ